MENLIKIIKIPKSVKKLKLKTRTFKNGNFRKIREQNENSASKESTKI